MEVFPTSPHGMLPECFLTATNEIQFKFWLFSKTIIKISHNLDCDHEIGQSLDKFLKRKKLICKSGYTSIDHFRCQL